MSISTNRLCLIVIALSFCIVNHLTSSFLKTYKFGNIVYKFEAYEQRVKNIVVARAAAE